MAGSIPMDLQGRLGSSKRVFRALYELRMALREVTEVGTLRDRSSQAQAWDALEGILSCRKLVVSEMLRGAICETVVWLYAGGDAGASF